ncbi:hypothetical protein EK21DRAFT_90843 [Setomelanomma holmii]|uniref:Uncharacterized protein n=1 Tax=Setomelanomma holmii TaxID=210430 RepID=A0A9P4H729_9PLEO|nr:hypothetical protein EK21DRAFT_90843 [Setomelanomma holmii]
MAPIQFIHTRMAAISQHFPAKSATRTLSAGALGGLIIAFIIAFALITVFRYRISQTQSTSTQIIFRHEHADISIKRRESKRSIEVQEVQEVSKVVLHKKSLAPSRDVGLSNHGSMQVKGIRREDIELQEVQEVSRIVLHKKSSVPSRDVGRSNHGSMQVKGIRRENEYNVRLGIERN